MGSYPLVGEWLLLYLILFLGLVLISALFAGILAALIAVIDALVHLWIARMGLHDGALGQVFWGITHVGSSAVSSFSSASLASCSSSNQSG